DYLRQIEPYFQQFGRDAVYVMHLDDLVTSPTATLRDLFRWLQVEESVQIDTSRRYNLGPERLLQTRRGLVFIDTFSKHWRMRQIAIKTPLLIRKILGR